MRPERLGVIGLGAIGGSLAWQAARRGIRVVGCTRETHDGAQALRAGAITDLVWSPEAVVAQADLTVLCAPPDANLSLLAQVAPALRAGTGLATDVTSVQAPMARQAAALGLDERFVGSHPFRGTQRSGFAGAAPDLLTGALVYVTPPRPGLAVTREIADFWDRLCDAEVVTIPPEAHDRQLAWTSHLAQAAASALALAVSRGAPPGVTIGPGARDTTRLAAGEPEVWTGILLHNRGPVLDALRTHGEILGELAGLLEAGDREGLASWLTAAAAYRRGLDP